MQNRMKNHPLNEAGQLALLHRTQTGSLATLNEDGSPYVLPVHFIFMDGSLYFHGLPQGQKLDNLKRNDAVCFCAYEMKGLLLDGSGVPCEVNTEYESVVISGKAEIVEQSEEKAAAFTKIIEKYTPGLSFAAIRQAALQATMVVKIVPTQITGKYFG